MGHFEVGLSEIQFSNSYYNVEKGECWIQLRATETTEQHHTDVPEGLYDTGDNFIYVINNLIKSAVRERSSEQGRIKFYYNRANKKASITIYEKGCVVMLSPVLQQLLEMEKETMWGKGHFVAKKMMDLHKDFYSVFVYSDLVEQRPVGDAMMPLLYIVPVNEKKADIVNHTFEKPQYIPLIRHQFNIVEILLTTGTGKPISFGKGKTVVTLHFRRRRPGYY